MKKRLLSILLAATMMIATVACGNNEAQKEAEQPATEESANAEVEESTEPVSLRMVLYQDAGTRNVEFFKNEFHDKVLEDINIDITVECLPWGSEDQIMTMAASGEGFAYMGGLPNRAPVMLAGLCASFEEEMFNELAPNYTAARMGHGFTCQKYQGKIYGIPCGSTVYGDMNDNFAVRNDILNEVGWDVKDIKNYEDLMEAVAAVHEKYPEMKIYACVENLYSALWDDVSQDDSHIYAVPSDIVVVDDSKPDSDEVISNFETEYFKNFCYLTKDWYEKGYFTVEDMTDSAAIIQAFKSGNALMMYTTAEALYNHELGLDAAIEGADIQFLKLKSTPKLMQKDSNWAWMVTKGDQDKTEAWVRFFDWIYASKENYMFSLYGVEGTDWQMVDGKVEKLTTDGFIPDWMMLTLLYQNVSTDVYDAEEVEEYLKWDEDAIYTKKAGFIFDSSVIDAEATQIKAIVDEKLKPIIYGIGDYDKDFPAVLEELKAAGLDTYVAEYQKQFSEFMASK